MRHMPPSTPHSNSARRSVAVLQPFSSVLLHACLQEDEQADVWLRLLACCSRSTQCGSEASKKLVAVYKAQQTGELMHRMHRCSCSTQIKRSSLLAWRCLHGVQL